MNFGGTVHLNRMGVCVIFLGFIIIALYMLKDVEELETNKISTINVKQVLLSALELAKKGGDEVVKVRRQADILIHSKGKTKEGANNPVTEADYNSHCVMYFGLKKAFPKLKIISEEEIQEAKCGDLASSDIEIEPADPGVESLLDEELPAKDLTAWIDPLDATQEFTENLLQYVTTLVCVAYKGRPIIGVIHRPFGDEPRTTWAWVQRGMSMDLKSYKNVDSDASVIVSRSHSGTVESVVKRALGPDTNVVKAGGAGYKVMQVVSGNSSSYVHITTIKKWDICAGDAVISAFGGTMTTLTGEEIEYGSTSPVANTNGLLVTRDHHLIYLEKFHKALQRDLNI